MKTRMMKLAEDNPDIFEYHEGMNGGITPAEEVSADAYEAGIAVIPRHDENH